MYNQSMINQLLRQKDTIDNMISQYSQPQPIQNIINTGIEFEARMLKDGEDISNIAVIRRTLFIDEKNKKISIKELDGSISKEYEIVVPLDEKDKKILELEQKLEEMEKKIEYSKSIESNAISEQSITITDGNAK